MITQTKRIIVATLVLAIVSTPSLRAANPNLQQQPQTNNKTIDSRREAEQKIERRDRERNGIVVEEPKIYDDALLQQMLQAAEDRLATIQTLDQVSIMARLGSVTGASQQISSVGFSAQGLPLPGITTTSKGATGSTVQTTAAGASNSGFTSTSGLASQDVTTTMPQVSPPSVTAPAPTTSLPSAFSVSASDILNEQAQLTAEIESLRLLIRGSLSDHFVKPSSTTNLTKKKMTLGFPITVNADKRYKDAVAVVEVEVGTPTDDQIREDYEVESADEQIDSALISTRARTFAKDPPAVTVLLPREKTYNVAAITDKSVSIGGGVATQLLGVAGSWLRGRKTYYLVKDQDTVALSYRPEGGNRVGFMWQFRPVLGAEYVKSGLKQTFVQLAFVAPDGADTVGSVTVRTYWRRYDRKKAIVGDIIPDSFQSYYSDQPIHIFLLNRGARTLNNNSLEDLGGGQMLVKLPGRYLPGTYVRIGSTLLTPGPQLTYEYEGIRFIAPITDLATKGAFLVAHDGTESLLALHVGQCSQQNPIKINALKIQTVDDTNSRLTVEVNETSQETRFPKRVIVIGSRVFGYSDSPVVRRANTLSAVVPNALLTANPDVRVQILLPPRGCVSDPVAALRPINPDRLILLERGEHSATFLFSGTRLTTVRVLSPSDTRIVDLGAPQDPDKLRLLILSSDGLKTNKQVLLQRDNEPPFLLTIPELDPKKPDPPKARERVTVGADEAVIDGDGMKDLVKVTFKKVEITSKEIASDGKSVRLAGLRALGVTSTAASQPIVLEFKSGAKVSVTLEIVDSKVETVIR